MNDGSFAIRWFIVLVFAGTVNSYTEINGMWIVGAYLVWRGYRHWSTARWENEQMALSSAIYNDPSYDVRQRALQALAG